MSHGLPLHPRDVLRLHQERRHTAHNLRAEVAASKDRAEALKRVDAYLQMLDEERARLVSAAHALLADED